METMGQKFKTAREKKKMTLSRAAALTHIKIQNLEMMENDDFSKIPAPTYAKGFIRIYSGLLGLDSEPLIQEYLDRHLNAGDEDKPVSRAGKTDAEKTGEDAGSSASNLGQHIRDAALELQKKLAALVPQLPRVGVALVAALLLVGVVRCAVRLGSDSAEEELPPGRLDSRAIMKEPVVRYLDLPGTEEKQP